MKKLNKLLLVVLILSIIMSSAIYVLGNTNINTNNREKIDQTVDSEIHVKCKNDKLDIKLKYDYSLNLPNSKSKIHTYTNETKDEYFVDENQKIVGVHYNQKELNRKPNLNVNQLKKIAQKEVERYIDIKDYDFETYRYSEHLQNYTFVWTKYINKIKTVDSIQVTVNNKGELISTVMPHVGLFDANDREKIELSKNHINKKEADELLDKAINNNFSKLNDLNLNNYSILEKELCFIKSRELVWKYYISLEYYNTDSRNDLSLGEYILIDAISGKIIEMQ
ncbi:hypothetical protein RBH29_11015 [Herbivorax sp. ANBcel31]|uniref:hypothetical protein n=1 Tax=Herbivorax sp. ANBcel31 TaxID=3069754 RepID=UPI0027B0DFD8|nr:hypothetical protein [Herbivorax sp. ANBcel31]MDQ2086958.1 hypothetical protein [Herbivorax sp. ANBcel31]